MRIAERPFPAGTILGEAYRVLQPLTANDLWVVYLTESIDGTGPQIAVKVTDAGSLRAEALRLSAVSTGTPSPFPAFYRLFQDGPLSCIAMEYIPGITLYNDLFGSVSAPGRGRLTKEEVVAVGVQLAAAAVSLHVRRSPLIFCGFRPANILLDQRQPGRVCLPDLSVARPPTQAGREQSPILAIRGPEGYMPPKDDQMITPGTDIYGLGATLWVLLTGEESWQERGVLGNWSVSPLVRLLRSMVEVNPRRRPKTMAEVGERLSRMDRLSDPTPAPTPVVPKSSPIPRRASALQSKPTALPPTQKARSVPRRSGMWK